MRIAAKLLSLVLVLIGTVAAADAPHDMSREAEARAHYDAGRTNYDLGHYREAVNELEAGYRIFPRPLFLVNLAQAHRKLHELDEARRLLQKFLNHAEPNDAHIPQVKALIDQLDAELAATTPPTPPPETPTPIKPTRRHVYAVPAIVGGAALLSATTGAILVATINPDYRNLKAHWAASSADRSQLTALKARDYTGDALLGVAAALAVVDVILFVRAARASTRLRATGDSFGLPPNWGFRF